MRGRGMHARACVVLLALVGLTLFPSRTSVAESVVYLIIELPGLGAGVRADADGVTVSAYSVFFNGNSVGHIRPVEANCDAPHYHGTLHGEADPKPTACGWGRVAKSDDATHVFKDVRFAVDKELLAREALMSDPVEWGPAKGRCDLSQHHLDDALEEVRKLRRKDKLTGDAATEVTADLKAAKEGDKRCEAQAKDKDAGARDPLNAAIDSKRAALGVLKDAGLVLK